MKIQPLKINGAWLVSNPIYDDTRGSFQELFVSDEITALTGSNFIVEQVNQSVSRAGSLRGIHWTSGTPAMSKIIYCSSGSIRDYVVDVNPKSETFGSWDSVVLDNKSGLSVLILGGVGHGFLSLADDTVVTYLCDQRYNPALEKTLNPLDPELNLLGAQLHSPEPIILSEKDRSAPYLMEIF